MSIFQESRGLHREFGMAFGLDVTDGAPRDFGCKPSPTWIPLPDLAWSATWGDALKLGREKVIRGISHGTPDGIRVDDKRCLKGKRVALVTQGI
ncbi:MAG: hypothetical protein M3R02_03460 [Chloroflexota bacterium]|nr:hypothetical protein [Chloroflexota bacterium]